MENIITTLYEHEINPVAPITDENNFKEERHTVKAVIFDEEGNIAMNGYDAQPGTIWETETYRIPGGGIDEGETPEQALHREILEEVGCQIKDIKPLGLIVEYGTKPGLKQVAYCFTATIDGRKGETLPTEKELTRGQKSVWLPQGEIIAKTNLGFDSLSKERSLVLLRLALQK